MVSKTEVNLEIEPQNYFKNLLDNFEYREKGRVRQRLILWFLMQFKYATQKQLAQLIDDKHRNISKILKRLEEMQYVKIKQIFDFFNEKYIFITFRGLSEIAERWAEILGGNLIYKKPLKVEYDKSLIGFAMNHFSSEQVVIKGNIYKKLISHFASKSVVFKNYNKPDLVVIKRYKDKEFVIGIDFISSTRQLDKHLDYMSHDMGKLFHGYWFVSYKNKKNLLDKLAKKAIYADDSFYSLLEMTNLKSENYDRIPVLCETVETEKYVNRIKDIFLLEKYLNKNFFLQRF